MPLDYKDIALPLIPKGKGKGEGKQQRAVKEEKPSGSDCLDNEEEKVGGQNDGGEGNQVESQRQSEPESSMGEIQTKKMKKELALSFLAPVEDEDDDEWLESELESEDEEGRETPESWLDRFRRKREVKDEGREVEEVTRPLLRVSGGGAPLRFQVEELLQEFRARSDGLVAGLTTKAEEGRRFLREKWMVDTDSETAVREEVVKGLDGLVVEIGKGEGEVEGIINMRTHIQKLCNTHEVMEKFAPGQVAQLFKGLDGIVIEVLAAMNKADETRTELQKKREWLVDGPDIEQDGKEIEETKEKRRKRKRSKKKTRGA